MKSDHEKSGCFVQRRSVRHEVSSDVTLRQQAQFDVEVKVRDVSHCGFMAECVEPVTIGSYIGLDVPGVGLVEAQVRWQIGRRMGGRFTDPISLSDCEWTAVQMGQQQAA
jgi:hypothetical protein